jgi:hypothetical protein
MICNLKTLRATLKMGRRNDHPRRHGRLNPATPADLSLCVPVFFAMPVQMRLVGSDPRIKSGTTMTMVESQPIRCPV